MKVTPESPDGHRALIDLLFQTVQEQVGHIGHGRGRLLIPPLANGRSGRYADMHAHRQPQLFFQISGLSIMDFPHARITMSPGCMLIVPPGMEHQEHGVDREGHFQNIVISYHLPGRLFVHLGVRGEDGFACMHLTQRAEFDTAPLPMVADSLTQVTRIPQGEPRFEPVRRDLMVAHLRMLEALVLPRCQTTPTSFRVAQARQIVRRRLADPLLSVAQLAEELHCSPDYLSHRFRRETGSSLTEFINRARIGQARTLLETTALNIGETARACGFNRASYFSRVFKQITGLTPRQFRQSLGRVHESNGRTYAANGSESRSLLHRLHTASLA